MNPLFTRPPTARILDWSLPGGQDHYFKGISELAVAPKMGRDSMSMVDGRLKVYGIQPSYCGWVDHATRDNRQYHGSVRHDWRACRKDPAGRARALVDPTVKYSLQKFEREE
jgi:hypothetical protein